MCVVKRQDSIDVRNGVQTSLLSLLLYVVVFVVCDCGIICCLREERPILLGLETCDFVEGPLFLLSTGSYDPDL